MENEKLFLGSFLSIVVECKVNHTSQSIIVSEIMRSIDPEFEDSANNVRTTRLAGGTSNPPNYVIDELKNMNQRKKDYAVTYFASKVVPLIKENEINTVVNALCYLIRDDAVIRDDTTVDIISGTKKNELSVIQNTFGSFLTGVFFYVLINTTNNKKKGIAKALATEYVEKARKDQTVLSTNNSNVILTKKSGDSPVLLFCGEFFSSSSMAIIAPEWDETNRFDKTIIEKLTGAHYSDVYENLRLQGEVQVNCGKGVVTCIYEESFREQLAENMDEHHMRKLLDSLSELLLKWSEYDSNKSKVLDGVCDFLAYYGCCMSNKSRLPSGEWKNLLFEFLFKVLYEKNGFACIAEKLSVLVEADPDVFVSVFERKLDEKNDVMHVLLSRESNASIAYPLSFSLRKAAAYKECFAGAMSILFDLTKYSSVFLDNICYVINLCYLQTEAPLSSRIGLIKGFFMRNDEIAWKVLLSLLPGYCLTTSKRMEFHYYPIQMIELTKADFDDELEWFVDIACYNINENVKRAIDLIRIAPILSDRNAHIISNFILEKIKPSEGTVGLLQAVEDSLAGSVPSSEKKAALVRLQDAYEINREELSGREAFKFKYHGGRKVSKKLMQSAIKYVEALYQKNGFEGLSSGFHKVEEVWFYCDIIRKVLSEEELQGFCDYLNNSDAKEYLWPLFDTFSSKELVMFLDKNNPSFVDILSAHECDSFLLKYVGKMPEEKKEVFWKGRHLIKLGDLSSLQLKQVAESYMKYGNYDAAVSMMSLFNLFESEQTRIDQVIHVLQGFPMPEEFSNPIDFDTIWDIQRLLTFLQEKAPEQNETIAELEEKYITLYKSRSLGEVKFVFYKMANHPEYVENLIAKKHQAEQSGDYNSPASLLLYRFKICPGYSLDGSFNLLKFYTWYDYADHSDVRDEMIKAFGTAAYHAKSIDDDFFMNRKVVEFIETHSDVELITAFEIEALNSVGVVELDPELKVYTKLAEEFTNKAVRCEEEGYIKVSRSFRSVASMLLNRKEMA